MRMLCWSGIVLGLALSLGVGCGGNTDEGSSSCGKVQPCGGNPAGTWKIIDSCIDSNVVSKALIGMLGTACTSATLESAHAKQTGDATFNADMTYTASLTSTFDGTVHVPSSCISQGGFTLTCDQVSQLILPLVKDTFSSLVCSKASDGCSCKAETTPRVTNESGTYTVSGTKISMGQSAASGGDFCVQGDELHLIGIEQTTSGATSIISDVVLRRQ